MGFLRHDEPSLVEGRAIPIATIDRNGSPHFAMVSRNETWVSGPSQVMVGLYSGTATAENLIERHWITMLFVDKGLTYYVKGWVEKHRECTICDIPYTIFGIRVEDVREDKALGATIVSGIRFAGAERPPDAQMRLVKELMRNFDVTE